MAHDNRLRTNRDLYLSVVGLCHQHLDTDRSLEQYLDALFRLASAHRDVTGVSVATFVDLLDAAFSRDLSSGNVPPPEGLIRMGDGSTAYQRWQHTISRQITDLHQMEETGLFADSRRYLGIDAPSGSRWYNFDPLTYIECGVEGTFGGWRSGDPTGREYVPGLVAVIDNDGNLRSADPRELDKPPFEIDTITWDVFRDFLEAGRCYE